jgi:hypothetical protein
MARRPQRRPSLLVVPADVFGGPNVGLLAVAALGIAVPVWAIADALSRPAVAFYAARSNRTAWVAVLVVAFFLGIGFLLGGWYLLAVRPKVRRATWNP